MDGSRRQKYCLHYLFSDMKIGIDARLLGKGYGLGRYIETLITYLPQVAGEHEYVLFLRRENWDLVPDIGYTKVLADIAWYGLREQLVFPGIIAAQNLDLMHFTHFNVPLLSRVPSVVTIHDLTMWHYPRPEATTHGRLVFWGKDMIHRLVVRQATRVARQVIVPNMFTRHDVHTTLGTPESKITAIYEAPHVAAFSTPVASENASQFFSDHALSKPYVLYVGAMYPHKNIPGLIRAWQIFCERYGTAYQLVLVGKPDYFSEKLQRTYAQVPGIVWLGFVSDEVLGALYARAALLVVPSLYEGFGLPPLEAFVYGVPVVSSNRACLPEVLGSGALYTDPESAEQMASVMHLGLTDQNVRDELRQNAKEELKRYSPHAMARETVQLYEKALLEH